MAEKIEKIWGKKVEEVGSKKWIKKWCEVDLLEVVEKIWIHKLNTF